MKSEIIVIGDELLIGQVIDTNSKWMASELNKQGWEVTRITTISDGGDDIKEAISSAFSRVDVVLMTGGLGPTSDDVTKPVLCNYFGGKMIFDQSVYEQNMRYFAGRGLQMNESTRRQAEVPDVCTVIPNPVGTAPIMWFEQGTKVLVIFRQDLTHLPLGVIDTCFESLQQLFQNDLALLALHGNRGQLAVLKKVR